MGLLSSLRPHRRGAALSGGGQWQWSFLDAVWAVFLVAVVVFLALVFMPRRGDTLPSLSGVVRPCAASEVDLLPCEDPRRSSCLSREMNYYRERHCPARGEAPACLVPPPQGYRVPVPWPESLHKIWHDNMPYGKIAERKGHQGWMKQEGSYFIFPGGGTMFPDGAEQYIEKLTQYVPLKSGLLRTGLDMGCGWKKQEKEWGELQGMTQSLCYKLVTVDGNTAIWKKPNQASCLPNQNEFGLDLCSTDDDPDEAWYFKLKKCITKVSLAEEIAVGSIDKWPDRLSKPSARASLMDGGASLFEADTQKWVKRVSYYKTSLGVKLGTAHIRNVMDMSAFFGGLAAAVASDDVWVMNVVPGQKPFTLGVNMTEGSLEFIMTGVSLSQHILVPMILFMLMESIL
ncbi:hypothetical protein ACQ4PT_021665 [Festuca glaucescens]